jgi:hypothetical protein
VLAASLISAACVPNAMVVEGLVNDAYPDAVRRGRSVAILLDPEASSKSLTRDLAEKMGGLLEDKGYPLVSARQAELFVFFGFGTDDMGSTGYRHHIDLSVVDADPFREENLIRVLWRGVATVPTSVKNPAKPLETLNVCIVDLIEIFGESRQLRRGRWVDERLYEPSSSSQFDKWVELNPRDPTR